MGQMRFTCPHRESVVSGAIEYAYLAGADGIPWRGCCRWCGDPTKDRERGEIVLERATAESGNFYVPGSSMDMGNATFHGQPDGAAAALQSPGRAGSRHSQPASQSAGRLGVDRIERARCLASGRQIGGWRFFGRGRQCQRGAVCCSVERSLAVSLDASENLVQEYIDQTLAARRREAGPLPTLLGGALPDRPCPRRSLTSLPAAGTQPWSAFLGTASKTVRGSSTGMRPNSKCSGVVVGVCESSRGRCSTSVKRVAGLALLVGRGFRTAAESRSPVLAGGRGTIPGQGPRLALRGWRQRGGCPVDIRGAAVASCRRRDRRRSPRRSAHSNSREFRSALAEYLATSRLELPPLHFADSLIRADLGIAGLGLELNIGYWPGGSLLAIGSK